MGVRGLCSWIQWAAPQTIQEPDWQAWRGKTIGIDILGLLYNAKARKLCPFHYLGKLIATSKQCGIKIVPIFDGRPPVEKSETIKQREKVREDSLAKIAVLENDLDYAEMSAQQRAVLIANIAKLEKKGSYITSDEREVAKQVFYACGIVPLNASGEADNVLAYFAKRGEFDAIISNDFDLLARGVETLLVPEFYALPGDKSGWAQYNLSSMLKAVMFDYEQFLEMCVLMGSDYTTGHTLPYKSAFWSIKYGGSFDKALQKMGITAASKSAYHTALDMLRGVGETKDKLMGEKQWEKLEKQTLDCELDTLNVLRTTLFKNLSDMEFAFVS